ncbi:protein TSSC4 [Xyrichtys novacula]|uniref:U5 small nuclear ribonucleoprotein TSSC4 n=1 Tax=Xyrichtys novacula TaxID=13765 RepID=A0AAV1EIX8_XYRNO|nr:protein TSSC4 [Xyrichtys novacula]
MSDQKNGSSGLRDDEDELSASDDSEPEERPSTLIFDPELDNSDEDDEEEPCAPAVQGQFSLKGGGSDFSHRTHNIFDCLDKVATPTSYSSSSSSTSTFVSSSSSSSSTNQQKDGVFTRPLAPPPSRKTSQPPPNPPIAAKKRWTPDYLLHPERWTHYSLEDVSETSDHGNTAAALSFLSDLQERKEEQMRGEEKEKKQEDKKKEKEQSHTDSSSCEPQHRMVFCRPNMPKKEQPAEKSREKETHLSHLQEEEEEGEGKEGKKHREGEADKETSKGEEEAPPVFTSFKRMRSKNYRKSSEGEEH